MSVFKSNNCFIACEELANKNSFYTGVVTGSIVSAVQSSAFDVQIDRASLKQLGSSYYVVNSPLRQPDVNLSFSYYQNYPYINEGFVNLGNLNDAATGLFDIPTVTALSGNEEASRNFYIFSRTGTAPLDAFTGFVEGADLNLSGYQCASVGNCYLTNYNLSYAVGTLPRVAVGFVGYGYANTFASN